MVPVSINLPNVQTRDTIYAQLQGTNLRYYMEVMVAGKYCVRERMYVDEDFDCEGCTVCKK